MSKSRPWGRANFRKDFFQGRADKRIFSARLPAFYFQAFGKYFPSFPRWPSAAGSLFTGTADSVAARFQFVGFIPGTQIQTLCSCSTRRQGGPWGFQPDRPPAPGGQTFIILLLRRRMPRSRSREERIYCRRGIVSLIMRTSSASVKPDLSLANEGKTSSAAR